MGFRDELVSNMSVSQEVRGNSRQQGQVRARNMSENAQNLMRSEQMRTVIDGQRLSKEERAQQLAAMAALDAYTNTTNKGQNSVDDFLEF